jgi:hypothetical protein
VRWLAAALGLAIFVVAAWAIMGQAASGAQPWSNELSDNFIFAKAIPFALGLGVVVGLLRGRSLRADRRADGAVRRYSPWTLWMHAVIATGVLLALPTGMWQYLGGILDVSAPIPLFWFYRFHYIGAAVILFAVAGFLTAWWFTGDRSLLVPRGQWAAHLRGLAYELPLPVGKALARFLRIDMRVPPPPRGRFPFYETAFSFPTWTFAIALITVTGLIKAVRYTYEVPGPVLYWASTLHVTAMVLITLKTLDHLRYTLARWPLVGAMFTGWLKAPPERAAERVAAAGRSPVGVGGEGDG